MVKEGKDGEWFLFFLLRMRVLAPCISLVIFTYLSNPGTLVTSSWGPPPTPRLVKSPSNAVCIPLKVLIPSYKYVFSCLVI